MNNNKIFNPFTQEFVFINSKDGEYIKYLEDICTKCESGNYFNQIRNKCIKIPNKKNTVISEQIQLCEKYIKAKKSVPPITKNELYNILNTIVNAQNNILSILKIDLSKFTKMPIASELLVIFSSLVAIYNINSISVFNNLFNKIYTLLGNNEVAIYFFKLIYLIITQISNIYKLPVNHIKKIVVYIYQLIYTYHYLPIFIFKKAVYFILGLFEVIIYDFIKSKEVVDNLTVSECNTVKNIIPNTKSITFDIFESIPNYIYYEKGGLLTPLYNNTQDLKHIQNFYDVSKFYYRTTLKKTIDITLTKTELLLLQKSSIIQNENTIINNTTIAIQLPKYINEQNTVFKSIFSRNNVMYLQYAKYDSNEFQYHFNQPLQYYAYPEFQYNLKKLPFNKEYNTIKNFINKSILLLNQHNNTHNQFSLNWSFIVDIRKKIKDKLEQINKIKNEIVDFKKNKTTSIKQRLDKIKVDNQEIIQKIKNQIENKEVLLEQKKNLLISDLKLLDKQRESYYKKIRNPELFTKKVTEGKKRHIAKVYLSDITGKEDTLQINIIKNVVSILSNILNETENLVIQYKKENPQKLIQQKDKLVLLVNLINTVNSKESIKNKQGTIINYNNIYLPLITYLVPNNNLVQQLITRDNLLLQQNKKETPLINKTEVHETKKESSDKNKTQLLIKEKENSSSNEIDSILNAIKF